MAGERLRVAADRHVRAQGERPLSEGRRGRVVDGDQRAGRTGGPGHRRDVADVEQRVAGRLQQDQPRVVQPAARGVLLDLRRGHVADLDAEPLQLLGREQPGRVVAVRRQDDAVAGARAGEHRGGERRHPGREGQAAAPVELADGRLEVPESGLLGAGVAVGAPRAGRQIPQVERGGEHRRRPQRGAGGGRPLTGPHRPGAVAPGGAAHSDFASRVMISRTIWAGASPSWHTRTTASVSGT